MKSRIESKAGGRDGLPGEGEGNRLFHPPLLPRKDEMHRSVIIGDGELKPVEVLTDLLDFLQRETDDAGHASLVNLSFSLQETADRFGDEKAFLKTDGLRGC